MLSQYFRLAVRRSRKEAFTKVKAQKRGEEEEEKTTMTRSADPQKMKTKMNDQRSECAATIQFRKSCVM